MDHPFQSKRGFLMTDRTHRDEPDPFANTRMPFGEHLEALRRHLWRVLAGFGLIVFLVFALDFVGYATNTRVGVAKPVQDFISAPVKQALEDFYDQRIRKVLERLERDALLRAANRPTEFARVAFLRAELQAAVSGQPATEEKGLPRPESPAEAELVKLWVRHDEPLKEIAALHEAERHVGRRPTLATMSVSEGVMVYCKVALVCGVVLGSPWIFWELWSFVALGLYPHEKRPIRVYLPVSLGLFLTGVLFCQLVVMPKAIEALLWFNDWFDWEPDLRLKEWLGFALLLPLVFGVSFQTPLVMLFVNHLGIGTPETFRRSRRAAWFLLAVFAAVASPTVDVVNLLLLWIPLGLLFELGIVLCRLSPARAVESA
jgi:sec-independent protein translocase protein TatC